MRRGRDRVLSSHEQERLLAAMNPIGRRSLWPQLVVVVALETGMRRGELLALRWADIFYDSATGSLLVDADTEVNRKWSDPALMTRYGYSVTYPGHSDSGVTLRIG